MASTTQAPRWVAVVHGPLTLLAAVLYLPALFLHFSHTQGPLEAVGHGLWWGVWAVFATKLVSGLVHADDRRAYLWRHKTFTFVVCFGFPALPDVFELVPVLGLLSSLGLFELVDLLKLGEELHLVHRSAGTRRRFKLALTAILVAASVVLAVSDVGAILDRERWKGEPHPIKYLGSTLERLAGDPGNGRLVLILMAALLFAALTVAAARAGRNRAESEAGRRGPELR